MRGARWLTRYPTGWLTPLAPSMAPEPGCAGWHPDRDACLRPGQPRPGSGCRPWLAAKEDSTTVIALLHTLLDVLGGLVVLTLLVGMVGLPWLPDAVSGRWPAESQL